MIYDQDRDSLRRLWFEAWRKARSGESLEPLERILAALVAEHPEYHAVIEDPVRSSDRDWLPEGGATNPFLHLGMHVALQEALATDRPAGMREVYRALATRVSDAHAAEHRMMECLAEALWQAQRDGRPPDEQGYLNCLRRLLRG
jgi:hypothetical protein